MTSFNKDNTLYKYSNQSAKITLPFNLPHTLQPLSSHHSPRMTHCQFNSKTPLETLTPLSKDKIYTARLSPPHSARIMHDLMKTASTLLRTRGYNLANFVDCRMVYIDLCTVDTIIGAMVIACTERQHDHSEIDCTEGLPLDALA